MFVTGIDENGKIVELNKQDITTPKSSTPVLISANIYP